MLSSNEIGERIGNIEIGKSDLWKGKNFK